MELGTIREAAQRLRVVPLLLISGIVVCAVLVAFTKVGAITGTCITVTSSILAAALGNFLRLDYEKGVTRNQARPALRRLFDHVARLQALVTQSETRRDGLEEASTEGLTVDPLHASDWFREIGEALRHEIGVTASSIEDWADLAPEIRQREFEQYLTRGERLPYPNTEGSTE